MADERETLIAEFQKLGLAKPERWASSQLAEGVPQLQRARVLYKLWQAVVTHDDPSWVDQERRSYARSEEARPGNGNCAAPHVPVIDRMLVAGISVADVTTLVRQMQIRTLSRVCATLDDPVGGPREAAGTHFGVFEVGADGKPLRPLQALHEDVISFDREASARLSALLATGPAAG